MVGRWIVAGRTLRIADGAVVKRRVVEIVCICMTVAASALKMVRWRVVASRTICIADGAVVKRRIVEVAGVAVASPA